MSVRSIWELLTYDALQYNSTLTMGVSSSIVLNDHLLLEKYKQVVNL